DSIPIGVSFYDKDERVILRNKGTGLIHPAAIEQHTRHEQILRLSPPDQVLFDDGRTGTGDGAIDLIMAAYRTQPEGSYSLLIGGRRYVVRFRNVPDIGRLIATTDVTDV